MMRTHTLTKHRYPWLRTIPLGSLLVGGCASATPPTTDSAAAVPCAITLSPRHHPGPRAAPSPVPTAPESRVVVHAEMSLKPLEEMLQQRVPSRLAEGRVRIGPGGTVSYSVERGALSLRVTPTSLRIEAPAHAEAEACRGDDCYARCEPEARVVAEVPLMLGPDYRFRKTTVSAAFTRGCKVRALGGLLTIDVTPTLAAQLEPELEKVAQEIDRQLPALASRLAEGWTELGAPREVPLGGCFVLQPFGVVQGPFAPSSSVLRARFAIQARPELQSTCGPAPALPPLPPLSNDAALPEEGVIRLGMVTPLQTIARAFDTAQPPRVKSAEVTSYGRDVDVQLALSGDVCGDLALQAALSFSGDDEHVRLTRPTLWPGERERLGEGQLSESELTRSVRVAPLLSVQGFRTAAPALASTLSQPGVEVRVNVTSAHAAGATARGDDLVAWLEARGTISLKLDALPQR